MPWIAELELLSLIPVRLLYCGEIDAFVSSRYFSRASSWELHPPPAPGFLAARVPDREDPSPAEAARFSGPIKRKGRALPKEGPRSVPRLAALGGREMKCTKLLLLSLPAFLFANLKFAQNDPGVQGGAA
jgi:hypothetical protein